MARATIDSSAIGSSWFSYIAGDLIKTDGVEFVFSLYHQTSGEHERTKKLGQFYATAGKLGRNIIVVPAVVAERHMEYLEGHATWNSLDCCDDSHIFSIVYERNVKYVFSGDSRLAECRDCMNRVIDSRYCRFIVIKSVDTYDVHKADMRR